MSEAKHTPGPWRAVALGGMSTVLAATMPRRNDLRTNNSYAYRGDEFCIGVPFLEGDGRPRLDYIEFSHEDARLCAAAPDLLQLAFQYRDDLRYPPSAESRERRIAAINAALAKAGVA